MTVGFDLDNTITRCPWLFALLSRALIAEGHSVLIITLRSDRAATEADLNEYGVQYTELLLPEEHELHGCGFFEWKADVCRRLNVDVLFDDMPEITNRLPNSTVAFLPLDPELGKLMYVPSEQSGRDASANC